MLRILYIAFTTALLFASPIHASELPQPTGKIILTITGNIAYTNQGNTAVFDRAMLENLPQFVSKTSTPWTDGQQTFTGPLGKDVLEAVGVKGVSMKVTALNEYSAQVPVEDFYNYDVVLALKNNGKYMRVRDKGPLFIVYPFDTDASLNSEVIHNRSVWQIKAIHIN